MSNPENWRDEAAQPQTAPAAEEPAAEEPAADTLREREAPQALGQADIDAFAARTPVGASGKGRKAARASGKKPGKKRRLRNLVLAIAGVAVLAGAAIVLPRVLTPAEEEPDEPETPDTSVVLIDKSRDANGEERTSPVKRAHVRSLLGDYTLAMTADGVLKLENAADLGVNSTSVQTLVDAVVSVTAEDTIATGVTAFADYGLDNPTVTVEVTYDDDTTARMELASLAVGSRYYLRLDGGDTVYLVGADLPNAVLQKPEEFVGLGMIALPSVDANDANGTAVLKEITLTGTVRDNELMTIRRKLQSDSGAFANSSYLLTEPYLADTNSTVVTDVFGVTEVYAAAVEKLYPTEAQLEEYGLATPYSTAKLVLAAYSATTDEDGNLLTERYYNETTHMLRLGKKTEDGEYYAMVDFLDVVFLVNADSVPWAELSYHDFANQYLFLRNLDTLSSITCTLDGRSHTFSFRHFPDEKDLDKKLIVTVDGQEYPTDEFRELYKVLMTLYRTGSAPAEPTGEPLLTVRVTSTDESYDDREVSIYSYSGSVYIARAENGDTYKMTASRVDDAMQQIRNYLNGDKVVNRY